MSEEKSQKWETQEDEDEEIDESQYKHAKDAVLFAIDVSESMLQTAPTPEGKKGAQLDSPLSAALKCAFTLMQQRIISNPNDMIGIMLYGTEKTKFLDEDSKSSLAYPHCYVLADLAIPAAEDVKALRTLLDDEKEFRSLMQPSKEGASISNVLFCANHIFASRAANFASRRLFIVTDNDNPHLDKDQRNAASVRAKDLYDLGVIIELFPISRIDSEFDRSRFYNDIVYSTNPSDPEAPAPLLGAVKASSSKDGLTLLNSLLSSINSRAVPKRALFSNLPLELGPNFRISVKGYIIFKTQEVHKTSYIWLAGEKPLVAKGVSSKMADDSGKPVEKEAIRRAYKFGGEQVAFTPDEISALRNFGDPGIRILGFKSMDQDAMPTWANITRSTFLYPSEEDYVGSTRVFSALHQSMLKNKKMALAWFIARKNAVPAIAAIIPGPERLDENGEQEAPAGLWLIPLPYADDIRDVPETRVVPASDALVDKMRVLVQQLQLPRARYAPSKYPNPALQWHYRILQAMALDEDLPEQPEDRTVPRYRQIHKRAGEYAVEWGVQLEADHSAWQQQQGAGVTTDLPKHTRPKAEGKDEPPAKRPKHAADNAAGVVSDEDMRAAWKQNRIQRFTVAEMKAWATAKGIGPLGKKAEIVDMIEAWFETKG